MISCARLKVLRRTWSISCNVTLCLKARIMTQEQKKPMRFAFEASNKPFSELYLQVLGNASHGSTRCLVLKTERSTYLFNCGEGMQRLTQEYRIRLTRVKDVFLTSATWENMGGLAGFILTVDGCAKDQKINIHGPKNIAHLLPSFTNFVHINITDVNIKTYEADDTYFDGTVKVKLVHLPGLENLEKQENHNATKPLVPLPDIDYDESSEKSKRKINAKEYSEQERKKKQKRCLDDMDRARTSAAICYICETVARPGKLLLMKCMELGVPAGPLLGELKSGKDITLPDGTVVHSKDVCSPSIPGTVFIVVECSTEEHLDSLMRHTAFEQYQNPQAPSYKQPHCVFHFTHEKILKLPQYQAWMRRFQDQTHHVILNDRNERTLPESLHKIQHQLHLLHPHIYPLLPTDSQKTDERNAVEENPYIHRAKPQFKLTIQPQLKLETETVPMLEPETYVEEVMSDKLFAAKLAEIKTKLKACAETLTDTSEYPQVIFLGTASSIPNKVRNTSAILLRIDEDHSILMDCGEATQSQFVHLYGAQEAFKVLSTIKGVYISHIHADHHVGLLSILQQRAKITKEPVYLMGPESIYTWLNHYDKAFEPIRNLYVALPNSGLRSKYAVIPEEILKSMKLQQVLTAFVPHCHHAYGVRFTLDTGHSIAYSGDTRPCSEMIQLAKGVDLLIHEATLDDSMQQEAKKRLHSTFTEALEVASSAGAKHTILTHFSQRYNKAPQLPSDADLTNVGVANDFMKVKLSMLPLVPILYDGVRTLYREEVDDA